MKKVKEFAIMILMITIMSIFSIKVEATTGRINSETVNIRKEPNTDSTIIDQLDKDCKVEILEQENGWYKIKVDEKNITGYVSDKLVETDEDDTTGKQDTATSTAETAEVQPTNNEDTTAEKNIETTEIDTTKVEEIEPITQTIETSTEITENNQYTLEQETEVKVIPLINSRSVNKMSGNVKVLEKINNWCRIENDTETGWIRIAQLKKSITNEQQPEQPVLEQQSVEQSEENKQQEQTPTTTETPVKEESKDAEKTTATVKSISKTGYVDAEGLVVREEASTSSKELDSLSRNDKVEITGEVDGWYQIKLKEKTGYVSAKYISDQKTVKTTSRGGNTIKPDNITPMEEQQETVNNEEQSTSSDKSTTTAEGTSVVEYAKQYLGCKYVAGGSSPESGFDCSGFTSYVYKHFGVTLSRSSKGQINNGVAVEKSSLQPGDIVVFNNSSNSSIGHVGIYIGGNSFIHAANPKEGVVITSLSSSYYQKRYVGARRVK